MENARWVKKHKRLLFEFCKYLSGSHFCREEAGCDPKASATGAKMENVWGAKNANGIYLDFANTCQDRISQQGSRMGIPSDIQRSEHEKHLMVKKHERLLFKFCSHLSGLYFWHKDPERDAKRQPKKRKTGNARWVQNINDFYLIFANTCQDNTFAARTQDGTPRGNQMSENRKRLIGKKP